VLVDEPALRLVERQPVVLAGLFGFRLGLLGDRLGDVLHDVSERDVVQRRVHAELVGPPHRLDDVRVVDEPLRGVAAPVQTGPAEFVAFDDSHVEALLDGRARDDVPRPTAEHDEVELRHTQFVGTPAKKRSGEVVVRRSSAPVDKVHGLPA